MNLDNDYTYTAHLLEHARLVVLKLGSLQVVDESGYIRWPLLKAVASDVAALNQRGVGCVIVTSGGIAIGRHFLPTASSAGGSALRLDERQAAASVGQPMLMHAWSEVLKSHSIQAAQVLLTIEDTEKRRRHLNARDTLQQLLRMGMVPVINENDAVATSEIRFGDNDRLAARVAVMVAAQLLIMLTTADGFYTHAEDVNQEDAYPMARLHHIDENHFSMAQGSGDTHGTGGMLTKLMAAQICHAGGCNTVIMRGWHPPQPSFIERLERGVPHTLVTAQHSTMAARKAWIAGHQDLQGIITIDAGARDALLAQHSLLPSGVVAVSGTFQRGDPVAVIDLDGKTVAHGLVSYDVSDATLIVGCQSKDIRAKLGYHGRSTMIHRDNIVLL